MGKAKRAHHLSFTERTANIAQIASPIRGKQSSLYITVETAVGPIGNASDVAVLHWVEMDIVDMTFEVRLIPNGVLPIAPLPDAFFSLADLARRASLRVQAS